RRLRRRLPPPLPRRLLRAPGLLVRLPPLSGPEMPLPSPPLPATGLTALLPLLTGLSRTLLRTRGAL
ncbi:hypothetical protein BGZ68_000583, partial [Mortierella alpina]